MAGPAGALADDAAVAVPQMQPTQMTQTQATGRVTYSRFLEFIEDVGQRMFRKCLES